MTSVRVCVLYVITLSPLVASCAAHLPNESLRLRAQLTASCVGIVDRDHVSLVDGRRYPIATGNWVARGLASDGRSIVSREAVLNLVSKSIERLERPLPGRLVDVSANGLRVLLSTTEPNAAQRGLIVFDRPTGRTDFVTNQADDGVISPDGMLVAIATENRIRVFKGPDSIRDFRGRFPSWLDATTLAFLESSKTYKIVDISTAPQRHFRAVGKPLTPLRRSADAYLMYTSRTVADFWSKLDCIEQYRVIVHEHESTPGVVIAYGCKGSSPASFEWIGNGEVCSAATPQ